MGTEKTYDSLDYRVWVTGAPYNDAYRYMDWLLTVPLLLIELILVMGLDDATTTIVSTKLGFAAALMIILGYPGEINDNHGTRWLFCACNDSVPVHRVHPLCRAC